jgi:hypothetical protein
MHTSFEMTYPNLAGIITKDDVYSKGTGSYAASYVAWARIANHLHTHAPGWEFHLKPSPDRDHIWKAPDGSGYLVGYFTGPEDQATADFPFPVMDNRNNAIQFDKISARALTDAHRRALCACAAFTLSLGYELWAKEEVSEAGAAPTSTQPATPVETKSKPAVKAKQEPAPEATAAAPSEIDAANMPITEEEYNVVIGLLSEVHQKAPDRIADLTKAFRSQYNLGAKAALSKEIKTQGHVEFINAFLSS